MGKLRQTALILGEGCYFSTIINYALPNNFRTLSIVVYCSENYMLERQEAAEMIEEVRAVIKDWRKTATELQISLKLIGSYSMRWDEL